MPGNEDVRRCIMLRESNGNYRATSGTYHGAYQMSSALARGATWMMQKEVRKEMGEEGVKILQALRSTTPNTWNRYWQDRAFWTIWRDGAGCRPLARRRAQLLAGTPAISGAGRPGSWR